MTQNISATWKKNKGFKRPFEYTLEDVKDDDGNVTQERGQVVTLQRLDMPDLLKLGIANEMDFMSKALMGGDGKSAGVDAVSEAIKVADNFSKMETMVDKIVMRGCLDPQLYPIPEHAAARQEGLMYIDEVPWDDRMELFSVIFETQGISDFREEQDAGVGNVADVQDVPLPADGFVADVRSEQPEGVLSQ